MKNKTELKTKKSIYFDYAASTPIDPLVLKSMYPIFEKHYANTMSIHSLGQETKDLLEKAREEFAKILKVKVRTIVSWAKENIGPRCKRVGKSYIYTKRDIAEFLATN